jgi:hypothetical protein
MTHVKLVSIVSLCATLMAADKDFNGRWNLTVTGDARARAWWLEVTGAGTKELKGRFVGAPGGQMDTIPEIRLDRGELEWAFDRNYRPSGKRGVYRARVKDGKLTGSLVVDGLPRSQFTGERAPEIRDKDDGSWKPGAPVKLFNGRDLAGWKTATGPVRGWSVSNGLLVNSDQAPDLVSEEKFWNFKIHAEFRVGKGSNSGLGLRDRYEVQIFEKFGSAPDTHTMGSVYSRIVPSENAAKPAGEWQTMDIRLVGRIVTVKLNGKVVIDKREIEGLTAMAHDPNEAQPGPISIQGDHGTVEFRELILTPLTR